MARIVMGSYLVQFPMGGYLSWLLQWMVGIRDLGHEIYFVERSIDANSCFDPIANVMTDDATEGIRTISTAFERYGFKNHWSFVDFSGVYHGVAESTIMQIMQDADLFIDMGARGAWSEQIAPRGVRVLVDGMPAFNQIRMQRAIDAGDTLPPYDHYYTVGANIAAGTAAVPNAGKTWRHVFYPIAASLFTTQPPPSGAPFTTIMSWQTHERLEYDGHVYGGKDVEFPKFMDLPRRVSCAMEIAVSGRKAPLDQLRAASWRVCDSHAMTLSFESFVAYIHRSRGEFTVCKNVFVDTNSGWFGDRAAAYLGCGRPVVMQDTGFSRHLPCGRGLFAVKTADDAAAAIDEIERDYAGHSRAAREIAMEHLEAEAVFTRFLDEVGV